MRRCVFLLLAMTACSGARATLDGGVQHTDAGIVDAGEPDAGPPDAGPVDAGCPTDSHLCPDGCHVNTDVNACGASCTPCPSVSNGTLTCDGERRCGVRCDLDAGAHACGSECPLEDENSCGPSCTVCPAPPTNAYAVCVSGSCNVACSGDFIACPNAPSRCGHLAGGNMSQCQDDTDCCSLNCGGTTQAGQCCNVVGSPCMETSDCNTYRCASIAQSLACGDAGTCCLPSGAVCTDGSGCCSGTCNLGFCQ